MVATLAIDFRRRGFCNFLKGGAMPINLSSISGYAVNSSWTVVDGKISNSSFVIYISSLLE
jgi:hypothetical protein